MRVSVFGAAHTDRGLRVKILSVVLAGLLTSCAATTGGPSGPCTPGKTKSCRCGDAGSGTATCGADGKWDECVCANASCTPFETAACLCADSRAGRQTCTSTGSGFGACECGDGGIGVCSAGQTQSCQCDGGVSSVQTCTSMGSWNSCSCGQNGAEAGTGTCIPGATQGCMCTDGQLRTGTQRCRSDGSGWETCSNCVCPPDKATFCNGSQAGTCAGCYASGDCSNAKMCGGTCFICQAGETFGCGGDGTQRCCRNAYPLYCSPAESGSCSGCYGSGAVCSTAKDCNDGSGCHTCPSGYHVDCATFDCAPG
jgi:hypothetical protein